MWPLEMGCNPQKPGEGLSKEVGVDIGEISTTKRGIGKNTLLSKRGDRKRYR